MKRVTHVITTIERGGAENQLFELVKAQINRGLEVRVLPLKGKPELAESFRAIGAQVDCRLIGMGIVRQVCYLSKYFKDVDEIIHSHLPRAEILVALTKFEGKAVFSRHNTEPFWPGAPAIISVVLSRIVSRRSKQGIAISNAVKNYCLQNREISKKCDFSVVHYGFPFSNYEQIAEKSKSVKFDFGTVARLVPQKNLDVLLTAFAQLVARNKDLRLSIIGEGKLNEELKSLTAELGIASNVIWQGRQFDIPARMKEMRTFVLPSKYEGLGLVLLEAIAVRVPIIAANNTAIPEVLGEKYSGLFETGDCLELASMMEKCLDQNFREQLLVEADARKPLFQIDTMESSVFAVYNRASER